MEKQINITTEDIQAVLQANPMMVMQVQNHALMRKVREQELEVSRLAAELEKAQNGKAKKEG